MVGLTADTDTDTDTDTTPGDHMPAPKSKNALKSPSVAQLVATLRANPDIAERVMLLAEPPRETMHSVQTANAVALLLEDWFDGCIDERLIGVALDRRNRVIDVEVLTIGNDAFTVVDPRQVFRWALTRKRPCCMVILAHNHPSGDPMPSAQDRDVTRRVDAAGRVLGIQLADHIVYASPGRWTSLAAEGVIRSSWQDQPVWTAD